MRKTKAFILSFLILYGLWIVLAGAHRDELIIGFIATIVIRFILFPRCRVFSDIRLNPKSMVYLLGFILVFLRELFKSAIDVARRVLSPRLPINPGIVKVRSKLKSKVGRIVLANAITLTPGTMTVETAGEFFYIHWIDIQSDDIEGATNAIVSTFERYLEVVFG